MKDEIKEILDNFKDYENRYKQCNETQFIIFYRDIHLLLNYITNLQEEVKYSIPQVQHNQIVSKLAKEKHNLQEENKRLNNIINELENWLIEHIDEYRNMEQDAMFEFGLVLDKLKSLKEGK